MTAYRGSETPDSANLRSDQAAEALMGLAIRARGEGLCRVLVARLILTA